MKNSPAVAAAFPLTITFLIVTFAAAAPFILPKVVSTAISNSKSATDAAIAAVKNQLGAAGNNPATVKALTDCKSTLGTAAEQMSPASLNKAKTKSDVLTWMSGAVTDFTTCKDGLKRATVPPAVSQLIAKASGLTSNALALVNKLP